MRKRHVAVTGAAGQIGSVIVRHLGALPDVEPVAICRNPISAGIVHSVNPKCNIRIASITEAESARKAIGDCDVIINCALAMVGGNPRLSRALNKRMIDNFATSGKLSVLIHLSSVSVYGGCIVQEKRERAFENPPADNDYGRSKLFIEKHVKNVFRSRSVNSYILRVGHVIGARMDRSRQILEIAADPDFRLPFDGHLPSNTIHVDRLASMVTALLSEAAPSSIYNVADETMTWRQVFNWHTDTVKMERVTGMPLDRSQRLRDLFSKQSIIRDLKNWFSSVPLLNLIKYPAVFAFAYRILANAPQIATSRLATKYKRMEINRQIAELMRYDDSGLGPVYVSDAMPGRYLAIPGEAMFTCPSQRELDDELRCWHARFSNPRWLVGHRTLTPSAPRFKDNR